MTINPKQLITWFSAVSIILILVGIIFAFLGLDILPVSKDVLPTWKSAIYGSIMIGWGTTLLLLGRIAFRRNDAELMKAMLYGLFIWLIVEALFSAYLGVWFNVGVDIVVLALFSFPLIWYIRSANRKKS